MSPHDRWALTPPFHPYCPKAAVYFCYRTFSLTKDFPLGSMVALCCPDFPLTHHVRQRQTLLLFSLLLLAKTTSEVRFSSFSFRLRSFTRETTSRALLNLEGLGENIFRITKNITEISNTSITQEPITESPVVSFSNKTT